MLLAERNAFMTKLAVSCAAVWIATGLSSESKAQNVRMIAQGKELFQRNWAHDPPSDLPAQGNIERSVYASLLKKLPGDGLGPMFNATSCEACHTGGGGAGVERNVTMLTLDPRSHGVTAALAARTDLERRRQIGKEIDLLFPGLLTPSGRLSFDVVVHESSARPFYDVIREELRMHVPGGIPYKWFDRNQRTSESIAMQPVMAGRMGDFDFYLSQRNSPPLFGAGLIDGISTGQLMRIARSQASRSDNRVTGRLGNGKFGWRAQTTSLAAFVAGACAGEVGLQLSGTPQPPDTADSSYVSLGTDLSHEQFTQLVSYIRSLPAPTPASASQEDWGARRAGKRVFAKIGCATCHVETIRPAIGLYSDLLLHDMGELLQAPSPAPSGQVAFSIIRMPSFPREQTPVSLGRSVAGYYGSSTVPFVYKYDRPVEPKFPWRSLPPEQQEDYTWELLQREWRTPPLWGVADSAPYLHDGRAKTLDAAIRWHGGEASMAAMEYRSLSDSERQFLLLFLKSLRSPGPGENEMVIDSPAPSGNEGVKGLNRVFARGY